MRVQMDGKVLTGAQVTHIAGNDKLSKSEKIRQLFMGGLTIKEIATVLNIRPTFAYNIIHNHIIVNDIPVIKSERTSAKDDIVKMLEEGKSLVEIAKATKKNYNYVWKIANEHGLTKKQLEQKEAK